MGLKRGMSPKFRVAKKEVVQASRGGPMESRAEGGMKVKVLVEG